MKLSNEAKIGILVSVVLLILFILTWKTGNFSFNPSGYEIKVRFTDVQGLAKNAPVTLNGFEQGRVKDIKILFGDVPQVELTLLLKAEAKIPTNAKAFVRMMGFMGEKFVAIEMKAGSGEFYAPGSVIQGENPSSIEKLLEEGEVIAKNLKKITEAVNDHLTVNKEAINDIIANFRVTSKNMGSITTNLDERLSVNSKYIDNMMSNFNSTSENLEEMSLDLKLNPWKLLYKPRSEKKAPVPQPAAESKEAK